MIKRWLERYYLWRYREVGTVLGDLYSYLGILSVPAGYERYERAYLRLEEKVKSLGYEPLDFDDFINHGGYGEPLPEMKRVD